MLVSKMLLCNYVVMEISTVFVLESMFFTTGIEFICI